jgi:hypothetical protein
MPLVLQESRAAECRGMQLYSTPVSPARGLVSCVGSLTIYSVLRLRSITAVPYCCFNVCRATWFLQPVYLVGKDASLNYWLKRLLPDEAWASILTTTLSSK